MGEKKFDNPQSANLTKVLEDCQVLRYCLDQIKQARSNENSGGTNDLASITSSRAATPALVNTVYTVDHIVSYCDPVPTLSHVCSSLLRLRSTVVE